MGSVNGSSVPVINPFTGQRAMVPAGVDRQLEVLMMAGKHAEAQALFNQVTQGDMTTPLSGFYR